MHTTIHKIIVIHIMTTSINHMITNMKKNIIIMPIAHMDILMIMIMKTKLKMKKMKRSAIMFTLHTLTITQLFRRETSLTFTIIINLTWKV